MPVYAREGDNIFEAFELTDNESSVGPGAGIRDLKLLEKSNSESREEELRRGDSDRLQGEIRRLS
jgi:hypothetical protein